MSRFTDTINTGGPTRLIEVAQDLIDIACPACDTKKEDVKDARNSLRDYIASVKSQLIAAGVISGGGGGIIVGIHGWAQIVETVLAFSWASLLILFGGLLAIYWLYVVWKEITKRVREFREALRVLDQCMEQNNCI